VTAAKGVKQEAMCLLCTMRLDVRTDIGRWATVRRGESRVETPLPLE